MQPSAFVPQLESIISDYNALATRSQHNDLSDLPMPDRQAVVTRAIAATVRITGVNSSYSREIERLQKHEPQLFRHTSSVMGVVKGLLSDLNAGYLQTLAELIHGEIFADFLDMAQHLSDAGYKDAAAVIAGSTLEGHLRALCAKARIATEIQKTDGTMVPKKADQMNSELATGEVYEKLDQKSVTAWLDLRNKAAHGKYAEYTSDQVALLIGGVRDFIRRVSG